MNTITLLSFVSLCRLCACDEVVNYKPIDDTNGGATTHDWTGEFMDINGNACSGCDYCDGTGLRNIFSIGLDNFCSECSSESTCNKFRIENKFGRGWPMKFIVLTSSKASIAEDPSGMTMHASIDSRTRAWEDLQILQSDLKLWDDSDGEVFSPERDKMHTYVLKNYNHEYYKDYALEWTLPAASSIMQVGTYHIDESYLASYSAQITQEMYGIACFLPSKMKPTPELMVGIVKNPTSEYVVSFDIYVNEPFTAHGPIVEFKACQHCSWKTYGSRMPSFWSHSARKPDQIQFVSSTQNKANPTQTNTKDDIVNIPGLTPYVIHTIRVVAVGNKVDFFLDDMITPKDTINQDSADRPPVGDLYVFLGAVKSILYSTGNVYLQNVVYTIITHKTLAPSESPTNNPSESPTNNPSESPTQEPTVTPPFYTDTLKTAVDLWTSNRNQAISQYGHISAWNTKHVTAMGSLFSDKRAFNDDISLWDTSSVTDMNQIFWGADKFNADISAWNVNKVSNFQLAFYHTLEFNVDISQWNVAKVSNMHAMFHGPNNFNINLSQWNVGQVNDMRYMFFETPNFNQRLCWDMSGVSYTENMFHSSNGSIGC